LIGVIVYHWLEVMHKGPSLLPNDQDRAFPYALSIFAPSGLKGIILAGFFAAVMASTSALANSMATIFTLDVYRNFWRKNASDKEMITVGRISAGAALIIASLIAPLSGTVGLFEYFQIGVTYMATPFIAVILMGIFWKRTNYPGAIAGLIGGVIIQLIVAFVLYASGIKLHWLYAAGIAEALTILLIIAVSLRTPAPAYDQVKPFIWKPSWLLTLNDGVKRPWWKQVKFWAILYALVWFYVYWRFW
jgi:SSS family solute:Na+ symporter